MQWQTTKHRNLAAAVVVLLPPPTFSNCEGYNDDDACPVTTRTSAGWYTIPTRAVEVGTKAEAEVKSIIIVSSTSTKNNDVFVFVLITLTN